MTNLNQYHVLVTRPKEQACHFIDLIDGHNGTAINFPTIEIATSPLTDEAKQLLHDLSQINIVIFVSLNAVEFGLKALKSLKLQFPETLIVAAVGPSTAKALKDNNVQVDIIPDKDFSSEGLLATPELEEIAGENILIIRGEYGRELLSAKLTKRHANVQSIDCYQRAIPNFDVKPTIKLLQSGSVHAVTVTSATSVDNLFTMLGDSSSLLCDIPFVVPSTRIAETCENYDIKHISVADNAGDKAMLQTLDEVANKSDDPVEDEDEDEDEDEEEYLSEI